MKTFKTLTVIAGAPLILAACTTTGNTEKNAAIGGAAGAVVGAVVGNNVGDGDAKTGAIIGGVIGAAGGAYVGHEKDKRLKEDRGQRYYDSSAGRYYYSDPATGRTYWENGDPRG